MPRAGKQKIKNYGLEFERRAVQLSGQPPICHPSFQCLANDKGRAVMLDRSDTPEKRMSNRNGKPPANSCCIPRSASLASWRSWANPKGWPPCAGRNARPQRNP
jgi:hypothetical protein